MMKITLSNIIIIAGVLAGLNVFADEPVYPAGQPRLNPDREVALKYLKKDLPPEWHYHSNIEHVLPADDKWWAQFDDPILNELIRKAENNNFNLKAAFARIASAQAQLRQIQSAWYPKLSANIGWTRERDSGDTGLDPDLASTDDYMNLSLSLNWEIDVFGRVAANNKAGKAAVAASEADYVGTQIALAANVAKAYITLRQAQAQLAISEEHLKTQDRIVKMTRDRMECGLGNKLEVTQAQSVYLSTKASIPTLKTNIATAKNSLAILCGMYPYEMDEYVNSIVPLPILLERPQAGVPLDLLRRRPDIISAEQQLAQCAARVGVAKKDFLPTLSLSAQAYTQSHEAKHLFRNNSMGYIIAPTLSWSIFEGFARKAAVAEARADMEQAIDNYNQTILTAVQEVNNSCAKLENSWESIEIQLDLLKVSKERMSLAVDLYKRGLTQFSNVTDAQINVLDQENELINYKAAILAAAINLYEAVGGCY